ncbi:MAG: bifunctional diguanylate cyclase/phosphodiesterase [Actinomycetota bacterium]
MSRRRSQEKKGRVSARVSVHLGVAFAICIVALAGLITITGSSRFTQARKDAAERVTTSAHLVADDLASEIAELPTVVGSLISDSAIASLDGQACSSLFSAFGSYPGIFGGVVLPDGTVLCSSDADALGSKAYAGAPWLQKVIATKEIVVEPTSLDPVLDELAITTALPIAGPGGRVGVLVIAYTARYMISGDNSAVTLGTDVILIDRARSLVLANSADDGSSSGRDLATTTLGDVIPAAGATRAGLDGKETIFGEAAVPTVGWTVVAGISTDKAYATAWKDLRRDAIIGALAILFVIALGFTLHRQLARPVRRLTRAIEAAGRDEEDVRAPVAGPAEIAQVARSFNEMINARRRTEERFRALVQNTTDVIAVLSSDGTFQYSSPAARSMFGVDEKALIGRMLASAVVEQDADRLQAAIVASARTSGLSDVVEVDVPNALGVRHVECVLNNLLDDPAVEGIVLTARDITERKTFEQHLAHQALHDPLTGLPNRALVLDRLAHALTRNKRSENKVAVLFLDLDRFKLVNDSHGHAAGDQLLQGLAERLRNAVRPSDTVARFGGDEFVAVCEDVTDEADALRIADRMTAVLIEPFDWRGNDVFLTGSVGIALSGNDASPEDLLQDADAAMYRAKEQGRARSAIFDSAMREQAMTRLQTESALHRALEREEFIVYYQPKISLTDGRITGVEALVRWSSPDRGLVPPAEFISVAEETGLIVPIGEWVLTEAASQVASWGREDIQLAVNISPRQLAQRDLPQVVEAALATAGLPAHRLMLEITEGMLMVDAEGAAIVLGELRELGVRISIDDFGTGHSSLGYLQRFPINELKIDRSFVASLGDGGPSTAIVGSVVGLAHAIELDVVAEGVETAAQLSELRRLGCDQAQGFYFAQPRPGRAIEEMIGEDRRWGDILPATRTPARTAG